MRTASRAERDAVFVHEMDRDRPFFRVLYSAPDGHTLMVHTIPFIANAFLYRRMPYDPLASFEVVSLLSSSPSQLAVSAHVKAGRATRDGAAS